MLDYRLYFLEHDHIRRALVIKGETDQEALRRAEVHLGVQALELWQGSRRVGRFEPRNPSASSAF